MSFDFMDTVSTTSSAVTDQVTTNVASYKAGTATAPIARTMTSTVRDKFGDVVPNATLGANFYGSAKDVLAAETGISNTIQTGADVSSKWPVGTAVCFGTVQNAATAAVGIAAGTVYYIQALSNSNADVALAATSGGAALTITGNSAVTDFLATAHPTLGCAQRAYGPTGTASVAWNDTATTATLDQVYVQTSIGESAAAEAGTTSIRYIAPSTTALNTDTAGLSTAAWTQADAGSDDSCDANNDVCGQPLIVDTVGNTMVMALIYDSNTGGTTISTTYTKYSWDSNDYFYINNTTASSEAGFEGSYVASATAGTKGLLNHFADGSGSAYGKGDMYSVSYQALAGNISTFKAGD